MRTASCFAVATLAILAGGTTAQAQHGHGGGFGHGGHGISYGHGHGVSYGHGGYGYGGHIHGHVHGLSLGGYYGSGYGYAYPSTYSSLTYPTVVAAPVIQPAVAISPVVGVTTTSLKPNAVPRYAGPGVTLRLPADFPGSVFVHVDKREVELKPGTEVVLKDKASYLVEFDRGGEFGTSSGDITEGVYSFGVGNKGWYVAPEAPPSGGLRRNALPGEVKK